MRVTLLLPVFWKFEWLTNESTTQNQFRRAHKTDLRMNRINHDVSQSEQETIRSKALCYSLAAAFLRVSHVQDKLHWKTIRDMKCDFVPHLKCCSNRHTVSGNGFPSLLLFVFPAFLTCSSLPPPRDGPSRNTATFSSKRFAYSKWYGLTSKWPMNGRRRTKPRWKMKQCSCRSGLTFWSHQFRHPRYSLSNISSDALLCLELLNGRRDIGTIVTSVRGLQYFRLVVSTDI